MIHPLKNVDLSLTVTETQRSSEKAPQTRLPTTFNSYDSTCLDNIVWISYLSNFRFDFRRKWDVTSAELVMKLLKRWNGEQSGANECWRAFAGLRLAQGGVLLTVQLEVEQDPQQRQRAQHPAEPRPPTPIHHQLLRFHTGTGSPKASAVTSSCFNGTRIISAESSSASCQHAKKKK